MTKTCSNCDVEKNLTDFYPKRNHCKPCMNIARKIRGYDIAYRGANREKINAHSRAVYAKNQRRELDRCAKYRVDNRGKRRFICKRWKANNPEMCARHAKDRYYDKIRATPLWLSKEQTQAMIFFYGNCPDGHHVDHIIPLKGKLVSGLHVPWNLQYLTAEENLKKGNKLC